MTNDQQESLNRVKASWAYANNASNATAAYRTEDMGFVLELLDEMTRLLDNVREDLLNVKALTDEEALDSSDFARTISSLLGSTITLMDSDDMSYNTLVDSGETS
jgi:hypothetical protein